MQPRGRAMAGRRGTTDMTGGPDVDDDIVESVLAAARVLVALSAQSVSESADNVTLPQLRVLVMLAGQPSMNLGGVQTGSGTPVERHPRRGPPGCRRSARP